MRYAKQLLMPIMLLLSPWGFAADEKLSEHPGFVDFSSLSTITGMEPKVEVNLSPGILSFFKRLERRKDRDTANYVSKLQSINVNYFDSKQSDFDRIAESMTTISDQLDDDDWQHVLRIRSDGDHVDIHFKLSEDGSMLYGSTVMSAEPGKTVFANFIGDIRTDEVSMLDIVAMMGKGLSRRHD